MCAAAIMNFGVFVIALMMVQSGLAIRCFQCDSASNPRCANMSDPNLIAEDCDFNRQMAYERRLNYNDNHHNRHWLLRVSDISHRNLPNEFDARFICQLLVGYDEYKQKSIVRRCQLENMSPCNFSREQTTKRNREVDCYVCSEDGCNGSSNSQVFGILIGFVSTVAVFKNFVF